MPLAEITIETEGAAQAVDAERTEIALVLRLLRLVQDVARNSRQPVLQLLADDIECVIADNDLPEHVAAHDAATAAFDEARH